MRARAFGGLLCFNSRDIKNGEPGGIGGKELLRRAET